jgi:hypothetical protein
MSKKRKSWVYFIIPFFLCRDPGIKKYSDAGYNITTSRIRNTTGSTVVMYSSVTLPQALSTVTVLVGFCPQSTVMHTATSWRSYRYRYCKYTGTAKIFSKMQFRHLKKLPVPGTGVKNKIKINMAETCVVRPCQIFKSASYSNPRPSVLAEANFFFFFFFFWCGSGLTISAQDIPVPGTGIHNSLLSGPVTM